MAGRRGPAVKTPEGWNRELMEHVLYWVKMDRPTTPQARAERIAEYLEYCKDNDLPPSVEGLAVAIKHDRHSIARWHSESVKVEEPLRSAVKNAYIIFNYVWYSQATTGQMHPAIAVFTGANNYKYRDIKEVITTNHGDSDLEKLPTAERKKEIAESVPQRLLDESD